MLMFNDQLKQIIQWVGLGASLVVYAHANFPTKATVEKLETKVENQATKEDVRDISEKLDKLTLLLLQKGN